ncbi:MAG: glycosyltransferase family 2 protein [Gemmataceae bacterium]
MIALVFLAIAAVITLYWFTLVLLGRWPTRPRSAAADHLAVLIPAHQEEAGIVGTIRSLQADGASIIVVVADHCTDATAERAEAAGATVVQRNGSLLRGKGHALAAGIPRVWELGATAVMVLDADCEVVPGTLGEVAAALQNNRAVQGRVQSLNMGQAGHELVAALGAELDNQMALGKARLGQTVPLRGTGMAFTRDLLEQIPWQATGLTEDAEYASFLRRAGVAVGVAPGAIVQTAAPPTAAAFTAQRRRWRSALARHPQAWLESKPVSLVLVTTSIGMMLILNVALWPAAIVLMLMMAIVYGPAIVSVQPARGRSPWREMVPAALMLLRIALRPATRGPWVRTARTVG